MIKKLSLVFLTLLLVAFSLVQVPVAHAQNPNWWELDYGSFSKKVNPNNGGAPPEEIFGERYTYAQVSWIISSFISIIGGDAAECAAKEETQEGVAACLTQALTSGNFRAGPMLAVAGSIDSIKSVKPASGINYIAQKASDLHIVPTAYAQGGFGFRNSLEPIQKIWSLTRNAAYALSIFAILVLAFMIMFRAKLSPQTVITIQSAIPRLIIGLLFITFSYAIAGLLVDLAFVLQGLIAAIVSGTLVKDGAFDVFQQMNNSVNNVLAYGIVFILDSWDGGILANAINLGALNFTKGLLGPIDTLLALVLFIILLIGLARIFWIMILTYAKFIFLVIAGPFIGIGSIINAVSIGSWIRSLVAQLSVFVSVTVLILFAHIFYFGFGNDISLSPLATAVQAFGAQIDPFGADQVPNLAENGSGVFPSGFSFGDNLRGLGFFLSLIIMLSVPKIANDIREYIQTRRAQWGSGIGQAFGPVGMVGNLGKGQFVQSTDVAYRNAVAAGKGIPPNLATRRYIAEALKIFGGGR